MLRARSTEAKEERRRQLLVAAERLLTTRDFAAITIQDVTARAGLAKATAYQYFATKEALFLELLLERIREWLGALEAELGSSRSPLSPERYAELLTESLASRPLMVRLLVLLHVVLEQNVERTQVAAFKHGLAATMAGPALVLEKRLGLPPGEGVSLLLRTHALIVGLGQMAHPSAVVVEVLEEPALAPFRVAFLDELKACLAALLRGRERRGSR